jgi:hypothetical protein
MRKTRIFDIPILLIAAMLALCGCEEKTDLVSGFSANELSVAAHRKMLEEAIESYRAFLSGELSVDYKFLSYKGEQTSIDITILKMKHTV